MGHGLNRHSLQGYKHKNEFDKGKKPDLKPHFLKDH